MWGRHIAEQQKNFLSTLPILGDPEAVSRVDKMFVVKVYCKIETRLDLKVNFHHEHFIYPTNCPWVSEDAPYPDHYLMSIKGIVT